MRYYSAYYGEQWPGNYIQGTRGCWSDYTECVREISNIMMHRENAIGDAWVIYPINFSTELKRHSEPVNLESVGGSRHDGSNLLPLASLTLLRFSADAELFDSVQREWLEEYRPVLEGDPAARGFFDVHYNVGRLTYDREPCAPADVESAFLLHIFPADPNVLPDTRRAYGFENPGFRLFGPDWRAAGKSLPDNG